MRYFVLFTIIVLLLTVTTTGTDNDLKVSKIESLSWLAGSWQGDFEGNSFECYYTTPKGGTILSMSKEFHKGKPCFIEFEKIEISGSDIILTPYPGGEKSVSFVLSDYDPEVNKAKFTNYEHDFPTEIIYELVETGKMVITVAGPHEDKHLELKMNLIKIQ